MNQSKHRRGRPTATQFGLTSEQGLDEGTDVTVVCAVVTRTSNEDANTTSVYDLFQRKPNEKKIHE
jgi:hypothetical protein